MTETELKDAAWYYPETKEKANNIKGYVAFCKKNESNMLQGRANPLLQTRPWSMLPKSR